MSDEFTMRTGRYVIVLDILGFRKLVEEGQAACAANIINSTLRYLHGWERLNGLFATISFSDTVLFYQVPPGYGKWAFLDAYALAGMLLTSLLAKGIPARGAIAFGELIVQRDDDKRHEIFCGRAFNEAYDAQENEKDWVGITICQSAIGAFERDDCRAARAIEDEGRWLRRPDGSILLNPFMYLESAHMDDLIGEISVPYDQWISPEFPNELRAIRFLLDTSEHYKHKGDLEGPIAIKYHKTIEIVQSMMSKESYAWAARVSAQLASADADNGLSQ